VDGDGVLCIVGQVLVQVGQAVGVLGQVVVHHTVVVASTQLPVTCKRMKARKR
jgi:hypothetical protein